MKKEPLEFLSLADPDLSKSLRTKMQNLNHPLDVETQQMIVDTILWAISIEIDLGYTVFRGFEKLLLSKNIDCIPVFNQKVRVYASTGASLGILIADLLPMVLLSKENELIEQFYRTVHRLQAIGLYILHRPLKSFGRVLQSGDHSGALQMLRLYSETFSKNLDYHQSKNLTQYLPKLCESLTPKKRSFQIKQMIRLIRINVDWIYKCEIGLKKGLQSLEQSALEQFIDMGIQKYQFNKDKGGLFFSIGSEVAKNIYENLQTSVQLSSMQDKLSQYLHARVGTYVNIRPISQLSKKFQVSCDEILNDGQCIYLPIEMEKFSDKKANETLYKQLVRWEAGHFEWGTYDFDLEKLSNRYSDISLNNFQTQGSDFYQFFSIFSKKNISEDLFTIFEHARIRFCLERYYPGIVRTGIPVFQQIILESTSNKIYNYQSPLQLLYNTLALNMESKIEDQSIVYKKMFIDIIQKSIAWLKDKMATVETSAALVCIYYADICEKLIDNKNEYIRIKTPLNRRFQFNLLEETIDKWEKPAQKIYQSLKEKKIKIYKSDIRKLLNRQQGRMSIKDLQQLMINKNLTESLNEQWLIKQIYDDKEINSLEYNHESGMVFRYPEWDAELGSYKIDYTRVIQKDFFQEVNNQYENTLAIYSGLLRHIRRRFEMLRPEGHKILRRWQEGEDFDYRQLLDYGVDRKIHKTPSDRLYTKRVKEYRDVAVFLLLDLSRSTANFLPNSEKSVLNVEQDAIILFCEALKQCGDPFSIAGFTSTGRHDVTFYMIKKIDEKLTVSVKNRIGNIAPLRSTRMGAALRHASFLFDKISAKIRLLIVLSDGFPNDTGYKNDYAIKDTRKAINEARSKGIYVKGITVNLSSNARLDDLYGKGNHHVISDVSELPDRLPHIYHTLTKSS
ncbi:von Willebrand factor type A [Candidatus Magnetomorum sp. HK-1]|nr:von Willebrand factor type A [Candidatus Magnetomorum sp. HK-1]